MARSLTTNYAAPWALVYRAGDTPGKRRSTRMAFITKAHATDGNITHYVGYVMNTDMTGWSKSKRRIEPHDIIKTWRSQPSIETVRKAKKRAPIAVDYKNAPDAACVLDAAKSAGACFASGG